MPVHIAKPIPLDQIDELIRQFRPIEQLFRVMGAVGDAECDAEIVRSYSGIGLSLTANFREHLNCAFLGKGEPGEGQDEEHR